MKTFGLMIAAMLFTGCANGMLWQPEDTVADKAGKTLVRLPLAVVTLGATEAIFHMDAANKERQQAYANWYSSLTPEQQMIENSRRPQLLMLPNMTPPMQPLQPYQRSQQFQCMSNNGYTNCF